MTPSTTNSPNRTSFVKGLRTAAQAIIGAFVGLLVVVWAVPGVPEAVVHYLQLNAIGLLVSIGVPSGLAAWGWNAFEASRAKKAA
jgi:hypothetical protein